MRRRDRRISNFNINDIGKYKVIATLLVRDEEEIVLENIDHHIKHGVDAFIVTTHRSTDRTPELIKDHPNILAIINEEDPVYNQHVWVTRMAKLAFSYKPAWVLHIDADEMWYGLEKLQSESIFDKYGTIISSNTQIHIALEGLKYGYGSFKCSDMPYYVPHVPPPPKVIHRPCANVRVGQGNHWVHGVAGPKITTKDIVIHHYPIRSYKHFEKKAVDGGKGYENFKGARVTGGHWKTWYDIYKRGELPALYRSMVSTQEMVQAGLKSGSIKELKM